MESPVSISPAFPAKVMEDEATAVASDDELDESSPGLSEIEYCYDDLLEESGSDVNIVWPDGCGIVLPKLEDNQVRKIHTSLINPVITLEEDRVRVPRARVSRPLALYRTFHEDSKTPSIYVTPDTLPKHRSKMEESKIDRGNAFQSLRKPHLRTDPSRESIDDHVLWNQCVRPSGYISTFNNRKSAVIRARFHHVKSKRIGKRISVAKISTDGLIPGNIITDVKIEVKVLRKTIKNDEEADVDGTAWKIYKGVDIPIWIRESARPVDGSDIDEPQWLKSGSDMWISITEFRKCSLMKVTPQPRKSDNIKQKGRDYEWLAYGFIPESCILKVMPFNEKGLHEKPTQEPILSQDGAYTWYFHKNTFKWCLQGISLPFSGNKHELYDNDDGNEDTSSRKRLKSTNILESISEPSQQQKNYCSHCPHCSQGSGTMALEYE